MSDSRIAGRPAADGPDPSYELARELVGVLPFGVRDDTVARCTGLTDRVDGDRAAAAVVEAIESITESVRLSAHHPEPVAPAVVRRMLHVLLATRDLGWPGPDAPLSVRRVAAADLFFDATQTVLDDDAWKGPKGVEFALLRLLAGRICRIAPRRAPAPEGDDAGSAVDRLDPNRLGPERLGHMNRMQRPHGL
jgi:hypothetical protein